MIACEYFFKEFHARGSDEYLNTWAAEVDRMVSEGWVVLDSTRCSNRPGFWTVVLVRPEKVFRDQNVRAERQNESEGSGQ